MSDATSLGASKSTTIGKLVFLLVVGGLLLWLATRGARQPSGAIGHRLLQLDLEPLTGGSRWLDRDDLEGKVVLMNFWGTWCPPCRIEFPHIAEINERFRDDPEFLLLSVSCSGEPATLRADTSQFMSEGGYSFQTYSDPTHNTRIGLEMVGAFAHSYPTTVIIDQGGIIRGVWTGFVSGDERQMTELIEELLGRPGREPDQPAEQTASAPPGLRHPA